MQDMDLTTTVKLTLERYFLQLDGVKASNVHSMVLRLVEKPMIECVMKESNYNQVVAAEILGISRGTLRKKLIEYNIK